MKQSSTSRKSNTDKASIWSFKFGGRSDPEIDPPEIINAGHSMADINACLDEKGRKRKSKRKLITLLINDPPYDLHIKK